MRPRLAAVRQDVGVIATGFFQCVGEDGQAADGSVIVNALC